MLLPWREWIITFSSLLQSANSTCHCSPLSFPDVSLRGPWRDLVLASWLRITHGLLSFTNSPLTNHSVTAFYCIFFLLSYIPWVIEYFYFDVPVFVHYYSQSINLSQHNTSFNNLLILVFQEVKTWRHFYFGCLIRPSPILAIPDT